MSLSSIETSVKDTSAPEFHSVSEEKSSVFNEQYITKAAPRKYDIVYSKVLQLLYFHLAALYGLYIGFTSANIKTVIFAYILWFWAGFGITGGAHRLWTHKTYKAKYYCEIFILLCNCLAFQQPVFNWVRDHRLHHKHSDTDADPHNASRGFFYSHIGWLMVRKNDLVKKKGKEIDMSDILSNPLLQFQRKYKIPLFGLLCFILPTVIPMLCWGETLTNAWHLNICRYVINLNGSLLVNSVAHIYGNKPYNRNIMPTQQPLVSILAGGEGFHNFHHCFPWDYRAAELGNNYLNATTLILDIFASMGWIYDMKQANQKLIQKKAQSSGDGTNCWGFHIQRLKRLEDAS